MLAALACAPIAELADAVSEHTIFGRHTSRYDLPGGLGLSLRTTAAGMLTAALFAPTPRGPARVAVAHFRGAFTGVVPARVLSRVLRWAPARPDMPAARPRPEAVASTMLLGERTTANPDLPGLTATYGPASLWLDGNRLSILTGAGNSITLVLEGPWDFHATAALADATLREATWLHRIDTGALTAALPQEPAVRVHEDIWHPAAAVLMLAAPVDLTTDGLGRAASRQYGAIAAHLTEHHGGEFAVQKLYSNERSIVALRVHRADTDDVVPLYGYITHVTPKSPWARPDEGPPLIVTEYRPRRH
ncbi:hypothetical protein ACIP98_29190 [Streptomyces sp. NPDC088354]|uniref:hypothetical protein n=1 Tax=Streptomyces sp. NPDC088354 TaxID=3365856 RepID=UPI00382D52B5